MTQSGQGEEPSAREAREGIVLPSDGGEPLLPGMTGGYGGRPGPQHQTPDAAYGQENGRTTGQPPDAEYGQTGQTSGQTYESAYDQVYGQASAAPQGQAPGQPPASAAAPAGGQAWGTPWGPDQQHPVPQQEQGWSSPPAQSWGTPEQGTSAPSGHWSGQETPGGMPPQSPSTSQPLPSEGAQAPAYGADAYSAGTGAPQQPTGHDDNPPTSYYLPPVRPDAVPPAGPYGSPLPPESGHHGTQPTGGYGAHGGSAPMPPADPYGRPAGGAPLPPASAYDAPVGGAPLPPADEGATQYIPPVAADGGPEGVTQYIPPVGPGALPPETGAPASGESTQFLGRTPRDGSRPGAGPLPPANPDAEPTQFIAPVPGQQPAGAPYGGERQPPAEFDNLFRSEPGPAGATQQMPRFQQPEPAPAGPSGYFPPQAGGGRPGGHGDEGRGRGGRSRSRLPVIAAVGVGIAVLGIGAGALLAEGGGGGDDQKDGKNQPVSAAAPASESASPSADPAEQQAVALDKLLADSGSSRTTVINAVEDVKSCKELGQAAKDLRGAAQQRTGLVTRLSRISVDRLPEHAALTDALTKAWQASASADNHYAAWADQTAGKKGCKKGRAAVTGQTQAGNRASGTASTEKVRAAELWNAIAKTYGLTERQPTQL
ncbi:hypothetical protein SLINC_3764 [Streptomyces lincolnensis]|uniref:Uncharacterized protein n=1 Tax=Streptomyces lincolnensis TaxID=1915 RepID=A0A1B1MBJ5_STRLN|nr:hypothetical protein [Streptomyces lincolnensis]ANS65988.1 hypothetical protein SLINC_3764 [Streptomyces lincolnensis]AXG54249.1 hypothetical protein SLCG_3094 [Streptomyces lincolnensis]QMV08625.1 hypothetical protein GJU35_25270 [Streptomyces lincolnensis]